ncbi:hypothetical protein E4T38_02578 [Aureobasidium subglaciale]|nr:hypothetical protein E4T38_02578 [Aureobasidium subglaciale]KAI5228225.1 hypothetical protein E4T40_02357 [Aureobasidium subglaciale]KAI5231411.1 hypothetical protein E4T41_02577 [Aureobasidium subglaciale]KAI5265506.1 hypothetical protein E4T46_02355 [Aureobasidium subglaciale]
MLYALLIDGNADVERTEQQQTKPVSDASEYELRQGREVFHITGNSNDERATRRWEWTALCLSPDGDDLGVSHVVLCFDTRLPSTEWHPGKVRRNKDSKDFNEHLSGRSLHFCESTANLWAEIELGVSHDIKKIPKPPGTGEHFNRLLPDHGRRGFAFDICNRRSNFIIGDFSQQDRSSWDASEERRNRVFVRRASKKKTCRL